MIPHTSCFSSHFLSLRGGARQYRMHRVFSSEAVTSRGSVLIFGPAYGRRLQGKPGTHGPQGLLAQAG